MVVVCGSANSWILDKLINNHGGLYNRVTYEIKLAPFTLCECKKFYEFNNVKLSRYDIAQSYMISGGIPYYMGYFQSGMSLAQNIDNIMFSKHGKLKDEYNRLFASIFSNPEMMKKLLVYYIHEMPTIHEMRLLKCLGLMKMEHCPGCTIEDTSTLSLFV